MFQRRFVPFAVSLVLAASAFSQDGAPAPYGSMRAKDVFEQFVGVLTKAKSIKVTYDAQAIGAASQTFEVLLVHPKQGYVKGRDMQVYLSGTEITIYNVRAKTYYTLPETDANIVKAFAPAEFTVWQLFLNPNAYSKVYQIRSSGSRVRKGMSMQVIEVQSDLENLQLSTLYTDPQDNQLRQEEIVHQDLKKEVTTVLDIRSFKTDVDSNPDDFTFQVPPGVTYKKPAKGKS